MTYRFDDIVVDEDAFRVSKAGEPLRMEPKALDLLIFLIQRRDRVVTKQELLDAVWARTTVTENALTRAIAQIRKVLGDDLQSPRYIQTVPTKGYRFVGAIATQPEEVKQQPRVVKHRRYAGALISGLLAVVIIIVFSRAIRGPLGPRPDAIGQAASRVSLPARALVADEKLRSFPSFSPDGRSVAYAVASDGTSHIFTSTIDGTNAVQVTNGDGETQPAWSPDGKSIAYFAPRQGGIWIVPATGGSPKRLTNFGSRPAWSPVGSEIAFQSEEGVEYGWTAFDALPPSTIWIVQVRTGAVARLTWPGRPAGGHGAPSWNADGTRLAFSTSDLERCSIMTIGRDGSDLARLVSDRRRLSSPQFSRDGRALYYVFSGYNASALLAVPVASDGMRTEGAPERLRGSAPGVIQHLTVSRDGSRLAWTASEQRSDLVSVAINEQDMPSTQLTHNATARSMFPSFSPDGSKIAYCLVAAGEDSGVWTVDADGQNARPVAPGPGLKQRTAWSSPYEVMWTAWSGTGPFIYGASVTSGKLRIVRGDLPNFASEPVLSPDGKSVAFSRTTGAATSVWLDDQQITGPTTGARLPVWSPSGRQLAMELRGAEGFGTLEIGGGSIRRVKTFKGDSEPYSWSPDERQIAFAGRQKGVWNIYTIGGQAPSPVPRAITQNTSIVQWLRTPAWSPDGAHIVYELGEPRVNVWVSGELRR